MSKKKDAQEARREFEKQLQKKYDCSWVEAVRRMAIEKGYMDKDAIFYRGTKFTYRQMFEKGAEYAHSMEALGLTKGSTIPLCTGHCPEEIFTIIGANMIGATIMPLGEHFDSDYFAEMINKKASKVIFVTDDKYKEIKNTLPKSTIEQIIMFSIQDSYSKNHLYEKLETPFYDGVDRVPTYKRENNSIISRNEFLSLGQDYYEKHGFTEEPGSLEDILSITFSSGTTNSHRPKPIKHKTATYTGMGYIRSLETPDLNKFSKNGEIRALVHIPIYSNTSLLASISDELFLGATLCLEHIYNEKFFPRSLILNKVNLAIATPSHWISGMKEMMTNPIFRNASLKGLMAAFTAGEPTSIGEEKYINRCLKSFKAAHDFPAFRFINALGMGGGDCENCGLWRMPHRATMSKLKKVRYASKKHVDKGYETYSVVDWAILDEDGEMCGPNERGLLVIDSPFTMVGYDDMEEETLETKVVDSKGRVWTSCKLWAYYDEMGEVYLKGRYNKGEVFPVYLIEDEVCKDTKNIMSCTVVTLEDGTYVAHIAPQPGHKVNLHDVEQRLSKVVPPEILERLVYKIRPMVGSYPLTGSGKRNRQDLALENLNGTLKPIFNSYDNTILGKIYIEDISNAKKMNL